MRRTGRRARRGMRRGDSTRDSVGTRCREDLHTSIGGPAEDIFTSLGPLEHLFSLTGRFLDIIFLVEIGLGPRPPRVWLSSMSWRLSWFLTIEYRPCSGTHVKDILSYSVLYSPDPRNMLLLSPYLPHLQCPPFLPNTLPCRHACQIGGGAPE